VKAGKYGRHAILHPVDEEPVEGLAQGGTEGPYTIWPQFTAKDVREKI